MYLMDYYTIPMSLAGLPSLSVPCGWVTPEGGGRPMPLGLELTAPLFAERALLAAAHAYERATRHAANMRRRRSRERRDERDAGAGTRCVNGVAYEAVIGIECHVELKTETKMFCGCRNVFGGEPNTQHLSGLSGHARRAARAQRAGHRTHAARGLGLRCGDSRVLEVRPEELLLSGHAQELSDLAVRLAAYAAAARVVPAARRHANAACASRASISKKTPGSRCTPVRRDGRIAGSTHSLVDFNRAGVPLMECVSEPDLRSAVEAVAYLEALKRTFVALGVSDVKMEEGSLRCDANVSMRPVGATEYGTKTEIKNMNSFRSVLRAIDSELARQVGVLRAGGRIVQETRGWDESEGTTIVAAQQGTGARLPLLPRSRSRAVRVRRGLRARLARGARSAAAGAGGTLRRAAKGSPSCRRIRSSTRRTLPIITTRPSP